MVIYRVYQRIITAFQASGRGEGKIAMYKLLRSTRADEPGREERTGDRFGLGRECERLG